MGVEVWARRDGLRELRYERTHCMGDSEHELRLTERPSGRCLYARQSESLSALPGQSGRVFYVLEHGGLRILSTETGELVCQPEGRYVTYAPDPQDVRLLATAGSNRWPPDPDRMRLIDVASGRILCSLLGDFAAFSPDGRLLAAIDRDKRVRVHVAASGETLWTSEPLHQRAVYVFFSRDGSQVLVADGWVEWDGKRQLGELFRFFDATTGGAVVAPAAPLPAAMRGVTQCFHTWF